MSASEAQVEGVDIGAAGALLADTQTSDARLRDWALDGIRGWAALSVVLYHLSVELFGMRYPWVRSNWLALVANGPLAVAVFFVLSGKAISLAYMRSGDFASLDRILIKRYPRLTIPALFSALLVCGLMKAGLTAHVAAAAVVQRSDWLAPWLHFEPSVAGALRFSLVTMYAGGSTQNYNEFLWTMRIELLGSVLLLAALYALPVLQRRPAWLLLPTLLIGLRNPFLACFFAGALGGRLPLPLWLSRALGSVASDTGTRDAIALMVVCCAIAAACSVIGSISLAHQEVVNCVAAVAIVSAASASPTVTGLMSTPLSRFLGRVSFPLFLVQFPIVVSLTSWLIVVAEQGGWLGPVSAMLIAGVSLAACFGLAAAFMSVERLTFWVCGRLSGHLARPFGALRARLQSAVWAVARQR